MKKKINIITFVLIIVMISLISCSPGNKDDSEEKDYNEGITFIPNMKTPYGTRLRPAQEGPPRSVFGYPEINLDTFNLSITGMVDSTYSLNWNDIVYYPKFTTEIMLMYCVDGWEVWGQWEGILIKDLLAAAKVQDGAEYVLFSSADGGYSTSLPISYMEKYNAILAHKVNGSNLAVEDGYPLRLVAFGKFGYKWIKWVNNIEVIEKSKLGYWENDGYSDEANVPVSRRAFYERESAKPLEY